MSYPTVLPERETLHYALSGSSLARYGDGELRLAAGGACTSQRAEKGLREELCSILRDPVKNLLPCIPSPATPRKDVWDRYAESKFTKLFGRPKYGSAFITRPDNAPWIDEPDYWEEVRRLWRGKDVTLVAGDQKSLRDDEMKRDGATVRMVWGPRQHAYTKIAELEEEVGKPGHIVLLCLGAAATCLAARLSRKGVHAVDIGHVGMFMRHAGAYRYKLGDLISPGRLKECCDKQLARTWRQSGPAYTHDVTTFARVLSANSVLDYGSGEGMLGEVLQDTIRVFEFDPAVPGKDVPPKPNDLVVSINVLEHVEEDKRLAVIDHMYRLAGRGLFVVVSTQYAAPWCELFAREGWTVAWTRDSKTNTMRIWSERRRT